MIINHNMMAMNTYNKLTNNNAAASKSLEKLSSGLRINRAGDDAAGLAISEKMRGQIRGLDQAGSNAQNGISLIQTAEGALTETHSILQRMRELAVQSANDTNTDSDRSEIQKEVEQLKKEIDRISTDTEFNTKKLLDGSIGITANAAGAAESKIVRVEALDSDLSSGTYQFIVSTAANAINVKQSGGGIDTAADISTIGSDAILGQYTITVTAYDGVNATVNIKDRNGANLGTTTGAIAGAIVVGSGNNTITLAAAAITGNGESKVSIEKSASITFKSGGAGSTTIVAAASYTSTDGKIDIGDKVELTVDGDFATSTSSTVSNTTTIDNKALVFHIGANTDQSMKMAVGQMNTSTLNVANVDMTTQAGAETAITTIQNAIEKVSSERAKLGAVQNRLEHTINNVQTASENITSAESRIRDVDMAKEMMNYQKTSILQQAATSMLAQANQQPQNVLKLLQ